MKILFLLPDVFIPPNKGNRYLIYNLLKYVTAHAHCDLALLVDRNTDKEDAVNTIKRHFRHAGEIRVFNKPDGFHRSWEKLRSLMSGYHQAVGNYWNKNLAEWLGDVTSSKNYDIVHFDMLYMTQYLPYCKSGRTVLVPSDAYSLTAMNVYRGTRNIRHKARNLFEYVVMLSTERKMYHKFDVVCPVAETDSIYLRTKIKHGSFKTVGVALGDDYMLMNPKSFEASDKNCGLLYAGTLNVPWVAENLIAFIEHSYPRIQEQIPDVRLTLLGKDPVPALKKLIVNNKSIQHIDFVEDYIGFLNRDWVYVHPQHGSAGYKTKIQQIMALGLPVVGSELAFTGMDVVPGEHCFLCKTEKEFSDSIIRLLHDEILRNRIGIAAAEHIREKYSIEKVGKAMIEVYRGILGN